MTQNRQTTASSKANTKDQEENRNIHEQITQKTIWIRNLFVSSVTS